MKNRNNLLKDHKVKFYPGNGSPFRTIKVNRNAPCKCGSGKKAKNCCGCDTRMFHSKETPKPESTDLKKETEAKYPETAMHELAD